MVQIVQQPLITEEPVSSTSSFINNLKFLRLGAGSDVILLDPNEGALFGGETEQEANAWIKTDGTYSFKDGSGNVVFSGLGMFADIINDKLDTQAAEILGEFEFVNSGAIAMNTDANNGVWLTPTGILGKKSGSNTFTITNSGDATFKGTIAAGSIIAANISANNITAGTMTGSNVVSASGSTYIRMDSGNFLQFVRSGVEKGRIWSDVAGDITVRGTDDVILNAGGANRCGAHSTSFKPLTDKTYDLGATGANWKDVYADKFKGNSVDVDELDLGDWTIEQSGSELHFKYGGGTKAYIQSDGDLKLDGDVEENV